MKRPTIASLTAERDALIGDLASLQDRADDAIGAIQLKLNAAEQRIHVLEREASSRADSTRASPTAAKPRWVKPPVTEAVVVAHNAYREACRIAREAAIATGKSQPVSR